MGDFLDELTAERGPDFANLVKEAMKRRLSRPRAADVKSRRTKKTKQRRAPKRSVPHDK